MGSATKLNSQRKAQRENVMRTINNRWRSALFKRIIQMPSATVWLAFFIPTVLPSAWANLEIHARFAFNQKICNVSVCRSDCNTHVYRSMQVIWIVRCRWNVVSVSLDKNSNYCWEFTSRTDSLSMESLSNFLLLLEKIAKLLECIIISSHENAKISRERATKNGRKMKSW